MFLSRVPSNSHRRRVRKNLDVERAATVLAGGDLELEAARPEAPVYLARLVQMCTPRNPATTTTTTITPIR
jgi:hypothetical protein